VVADGRLMAVLTAAEPAPWVVVSNAAVERSRAAEELFCAPVLDVVGVRAPVLDTTRHTRNRILNRESAIEKQFTKKPRHVLVKS